MSHKIMVRSLFAGLVWGLILLPSPGRAQTIQLSFSDTTAKKGDTLLIPLRTTSLTTQDSIYSGQFTVSFNAGVIDVFGVETAGSVLQAVGNVLFNSTSKRLGFASTSIVTGSGVLLYLKTRVLINPSTETTTISIPPPDTAFNEGKPKFLVTGGSLRVLKIVVSPKNPSQSLVVGDSLQFSVTGDQQLPLTWSSSDTSVGMISATGMMRAVAPGQLKIYVRDAQGLQDSTDVFPIYPSQARSLTVSVPNSSHTQTLSFNLPVNISDVTGLGIISGQFALNYNGNSLQALELVSANSMTSNWTAVPNITNGRIEVALSGTEPLAGSGVLVFIRFRVASSASGTTISFSNVIFNENLNANTVSGQFTALTAPAVVIIPNIAVITKGDTLRFRVTSGGTPPFTWSSNNLSVASINPSTGLLAALSSGTTTVSVVDSFGFSSTTGSITVNELTVRIPDTSLVVGDTIDVPLYVGDLSGLNVLSYETRIVYDSTILRFIAPVVAGTKSNGLTLFYRDTLDTLRIAASSTSFLTGAGPLVKLKFMPATSATGVLSTLRFARFQFNEGSPTATLVHGSITINAGDTATAGLTANVPEPGDPSQRPRWVPTGIVVEVGDTLVVMATGLVNDGGGNSAGPNGTGIGGDPNPSFPDWYNSVSHISLIGRLRLANGLFV
ncbi:MAG: Ig-like domain-containing protein, partial [Ignavibacteriales bacterium]|nr:Ig-like domain-containing protein [Ignavibacteriales bacterium]